MVKAIIDIVVPVDYHFPYMNHDDVLLIHMGGLGDMCLSESIFLSLSHHFQKNVSALGYPRFLRFFHRYFQAIHSIESAKWLYLFADYPSETAWKRIAFIGKDRNNVLRKKWQAISNEELIFIDMYPDGTFDAIGPGTGARSPEKNGGQFKINNSKFKIAFHVEEYQLMQLERYGIEAMKSEITPRPGRRVILYPEVGVTKSKWHYQHFVDLYHTLKEHGIEAYVFESLGLNLSVPDTVSIEDLEAVRTFLSDGGIFVSNDSGMAHFAGMCGLTTITVFNDFDPAIWHPRGNNISLRQGKDRVDVPALQALITNLLAGSGFEV